MTQIKLRRDTLANFTSSNPVLGAGEPAYETDTKKLKIGDGSTAYTQLAYFSAGSGGGSADITATLPLKIENDVISLEVDGQTIQIVDGKLHANTDELGNEVNNLSGRVTANEADIMTIQTDITDLTGEVENKQNKLIATSPIVIAEQFGITLQQGVTETDTQYDRPTSGEGVVQVDLSPLNIKPEDDWEIGLNLVNTIAGSGNCNAIEIINSNGTIFRIWNGSRKPRRGNVAEVFESINYASSGTSSPWAVKHVKGEDLYRFRMDSADYSTTYTVAQMSEGLTNISTLTGQPKIETLKVYLSSTFLTTLKKNTNYTYVKHNNVTYPLVNLKSGDGISLSIGDGLSIVDNKLTATGGGSTPTNMVTTDTEQEVTGVKLFSNGMKVGGYAGISDNNGEKFIYVDTNHSGWTIGSNNSAGWFENVHIRRGTSGDYINLDSGNVNAYITETHIDGTSWYRVWSDGWCEQGGRFTSADTSDTTVTFLKAYKDTNYSPIVGMQYGSSGDGKYRIFNILTLNTNSMVVHNATNGNGNICIWTASGYIS